MYYTDTADCAPIPFPPLLPYRKRGHSEQNLHTFQTCFFFFTGGCGHVPPMECKQTDRTRFQEILGTLLETVG